MVTTACHDARVGKQWKAGKKTVELEGEARPSRVRRDPALGGMPDYLARNAWWESREWEIRLAIAGIIAFALAFWVLSIGIGEITSH